MRVKKLRAFYEKRPLFILVDSDSTHNFFSEKIVELGCKLKAVEGAKIVVANDRELRFSHACERFQWKVQGHHFIVDVFILPLDNYGLILGV